MYINKIDELFDKVIDDFYNKIILQKDFQKYLKEINFVKYQLEINRLLVNYISTIPRTLIIEVLKDEENTDKIVEIIKKYTGYYIFLTFGFFYKGKYETFINNMVEFTKNQPEFNFRIENFFTSETNSIIIKFYTLIKNIITLINSDTVKQGQLGKKPEYIESVKFIQEFGEDISLEKLGGDVNLQSHNIIKIIILNEIYFKNDKKNVYLLLEKSEKEQGEFIFIDIVVPRVQFIDYNTIELSLSEQDVENGLASDIYDLITKCEDIENIRLITHEEKILQLINNKILVPIAEDFLLYHKDNERYEKIGDQLVDKNKRGREETKIKYIINKIDSVTEYFSKNVKEKPELKKEIEKLFNVPLLDRRAILVNNFEDIKIINKLQNQGRRAIENNQYYNDLLTYRQYPYINFKDFQSYGFNLPTDKTVDVIRSISFEKVNMSNKNKTIQFRISSSGLNINIIGFALINKRAPLQCHIIKDFINVNNVGYKKDNKTQKVENGYNGIMRFLRKTLFDRKKITEIPSVYWMFDLNNDKIVFDTYDITSKMNNNEHTKLIASKLYDDIILMINEQILKQFSKKPPILQLYDKIINMIEKKLVRIPKNTDLYSKLLRTIVYEKLIKTTDEYDKKEDDFPGLFGEIINLPIAPSQEKEKIPSIIISKNKVKKDKDTKESGEDTRGAICQHFVTWDNISAIRKKNPNKFSELFVEFVQQYVIRNHEEDYICKSCGTQVNIKNYVLDGSYDEEGRFVSFNMPMDIPLEDILEYEKYKSTIKNIEKIVERIASIAGINSLIGNSTTIKTRVRRIVKDTIDLLLIHNSNLKNIYKERSDKISAYGLSKDLSNLFVFELDNSIFYYDSKDKDFYKPIKRNNIIIYILFFIILELTDSQLYHMTGDKICNYYLFSKVGTTWFEDINILKNNQNVIVPIMNYRVLCYLIFYMSCLITKYNLWHYEAKEDSKKKFNPQVQKIVIQTFIDFFNSFIEVYNMKKKNYIYDLIANKLFMKMNSSFKNNESLEKIKSIEDKKIVVDGNKAKIITTQVKSILLNGEYSSVNYLEISEYMIYKPAKFFMRKRLILFPRHIEISNITNCEKGTFHNWQVKDNREVCSICGQTMDEVTDNSELAEQIIENYKIIILKKIAHKYCQSGELHNFIFQENLKCSVCTKCKSQDIDNLNLIQLQEIQENVNKMNLQKDTKITHKKLPLKDYNNFINEIKSEYGATKEHKDDYYRFLNDFISKIETVIGKDVNINNKDIYLRYDTYIIDHDHNGYPIDTPIIIKNRDDKIDYKKDHPFFKKDVIFYTNNKLQIVIYYDAITKLLLGFKEKNKENQMAKRQNIYLKVNYSIFNRIKNLGYKYQHIDISKLVTFYSKLYKDSQLILKQIIGEISRDRIQKLKKFITDLQRYIYRLTYNYEPAPVNEENEEDISLILFERYKNKFNKLKLRNNEDKFLYKWRAFKYDLFFENLSSRTINLDIDSNYISTEDISNYDYSGNVLLFYLISEMGRLIDFNSDKFIKKTLCDLLLDIIIEEYNLFDEEKNFTNTEIKRFKYVLQVENEKNVEAYTGTTEGFYEEYVDPEAAERPVDEIAQEIQNDEQLDMEEENQSLDLENGMTDLDFEVEYLTNVNFSG